MQSHARGAVAGLLVALACATVCLADRDRAEEPEKPRTAAEKIAGRWRISIEGLPDKHEDILASFAVTGELLEGSLTVGRTSVPVSAGRIAGERVDIIFHHAGGDQVRLKGRVGPRGLEGTWETNDLKGKWSARRLGP